MIGIITQSDASALKARQKRLPRRPIQGLVLSSKWAAPAASKTEQIASRTSPVAIGAALQNIEEECRYEAAKAEALDDPQVKELKTKANEAIGENEERRTSIAYNRMLFKKMRQIDQSLAERVGLVEAAIVKRFNQ